LTILSHPSVNSYTRNISLALAEGGTLEKFYTTLGWGPPGAGRSWIPRKIARERTRRELHPDVAPKVASHCWREVGRLVAGRIGAGRILCRHETGLFCLDAVYREFDRFVARELANCSRDVTGIYAGEDAAFESFRVAGKRGIKCFYDLPIAYYAELQQLMTEEAELMPEFSQSLQGTLDSAEKLERKDAEIDAADVVIACSAFVRDSLLRWGISSKKIEVIPYGAPEGIEARRWSRDDLDRPLRVIFVGALSQRKGIGYLLRAIQKLNRSDVELVLMGTWSGAPEAFAPYRRWFRYEAPRPHSAVLDLMRSCDVLVMPSIAEGFALVILEAMACGLPVIVTANTGIGDFIEDAVNGYLIPIRSADALAEKIASLADNREKVVEMGAAAVRTAEKWTWACFRKRIRETLGPEFSRV